MILTQITPPAYLPLTLDEVKLHCRVDGDEEDAILPVYISAATSTAEHRLGRSMMEQEWRVTLDAFPASIRLPRPEILSIESIAYWDAAGDPQTLDASLYELNGDTLTLVAGAEPPQLWDGPGVVQINYKAGFKAGNEATQRAAVPANIKAWLLLTVATMYANRESIVVGASVASIQDSFVDRLLDPFKVY